MLQTSEVLLRNSKDLEHQVMLLETLQVTLRVTLLEMVLAKVVPNLNRQLTRRYTLFIRETELKMATYL